MLALDLLVDQESAHVLQLVEHFCRPLLLHVHQPPTHERWHRSLMKSIHLLYTLQTIGQWPFRENDQRGLKRDILQRLLGLDHRIIRPDEDRKLHQRHVKPNKHYYLTGGYNYIRRRGGRLALSKQSWTSIHFINKFHYDSANDHWVLVLRQTDGHVESAARRVVALLALVLLGLLPDRDRTFQFC